MLTMAKESSMGQPFSITLHPEAEKRLRATLSARDQSMRGLMSRLADWFATLDESEQSFVLGTLAEPERLAVMERMLLRLLGDKDAAEYAKSRGLTHAQRRATQKGAGSKGA